MENWQLHYVSWTKYNFVISQLKYINMILNQQCNLTVCSCLVTYAFESESTLYSCLIEVWMPAGTEEQKQVLQETVIFCVLEIN